MSEHARDVDTTGMEEELAHSRHLIDAAKERAAELAEASPDPYQAEDPEDTETRRQDVEPAQDSER